MAIIKIPIASGGLQQGCRTSQTDDGRPFRNAASLAIWYGCSRLEVKRIASQPVSSRRERTLLLIPLRRCDAPQWDALLALDEREQVAIDRLGFRGRHAVREILVGFQGPVLQQFRGLRPGCSV